MKKYSNHLLDKAPILKYIINSFVIWLAIVASFFAAIYAVLSLTGQYAAVESGLDLKYNSPFVLFPMRMFAVLAVLSFVSGCLLYFHKYKRPKVKSSFYEAVSPVLDRTRINKSKEMGNHET